MVQKLNPAQITQNVKAAGFPEKHIDTMVAIALAESGGDADIRGGPNSNGTYDYGLFQINSIWKGTFDGAGKLVNGVWAKWELRGNPTSNTAMAKYIYDRQGLNAWSSYKNGSYKKHLGKASNNVIGEAVSSAAGFGDTGTAVQNLASTIRRLSHALTDGGIWIRIGLVLVGTVLMVTAAGIIMADIGISSGTLKKLSPIKI